MWGVASIVDGSCSLLPRFFAICGDFSSAAGGPGSKAEAPDGTVANVLPVYSEDPPRPVRAAPDPAWQRAARGEVRPRTPARVGSDHAPSRRRGLPARAPRGGRLRGR